MLVQSLGATQSSQKTQVKVYEEQLGYIVRVTNSLFGTGLPSSSRRLQKAVSQYVQGMDQGGNN